MPKHVIRAAWVGLAVLALGGCSSKPLSSPAPSKTSIPLAVISPASLRWSLQSVLARQQADSLEAVAFCDAHHGWAVGYDGAIFHTIDGLTWHRQHLLGHPPASGLEGDPSLLRGVATSDPTHAWASASGVSTWIYATSDGGKHWRLVSTLHDRPLGILAFANPTTGWTSFAGAMHTADGGRHWVEQIPMASDKGVFGLTCTDAQHVWAARGPDVLSSTDGGRTWATHHVADGLTLGAIQFVDAKHGWAIGELDEPSFGPGFQVIISSDDGGASWRAQRVPDARVGKRILLSLSFSSEKEGWIVGLDDASSTSGAMYRLLLHTTDGGRSWSIQDPLATVASSPSLLAKAKRDGTLWGVASLRGGRTYLVGDYGLILSH